MKNAMTKQKTHKHGAPKHDFEQRAPITPCPCQECSEMRRCPA